MKTLLTVFFACITISIVQLKAQSFEISPGTEWTYCQEDWLPIAHFETRTIKVVGDTLINGEEAFIIEGDCQCGYMSPKYLKKEEEKIYYFIEDAKYLLYDFSLNAGDTLIIPIPGHSDAHFLIDSTDVIIVNNEPKKVQYITFLNMDTDIYPDWGTKLVEDFGADYCLFPLNVACHPATGPIVSFEVEEFPIVLFEFECLVLSTSELSKVNIRTYPNPAKDHYMVEYSGINDEVQITFYDLMGALILHKVLSPGEILSTDVSGWKPGMYIMHATSGKKSASSRLIVGH